MIVHITDVFAPRLGGIEVQVEALARAQREAGEEVHVITASPDRQGSPVGRFPYPVHRVTASGLRGLLRGLRPRVVHIHVSVLSPFSWAAVLIAGRLSLPAVLTVHSMWDAPVRLLYRLLAVAAGRRGRLVVTAVSTSVGNQVARALPPGVRLEVVPNGIQPAQWNTAGWQRGGDEGGLHIVSVGRLARRREPLALLRVLQDAQSRLAPQVAVRATVVGVGPRGAAMERYLRRHRMDGWVSLVGARDRAGVREVLATADVYLNVTGREAFGLAALEARTAGIPVVARTGTGVADFVEDGREGLLGHSLEDLVDQLTRIGRDDPLRERIAVHNRSTIPAACSWPLVLDRLRECYDQAVEMPRSRAGTRPRTDKEPWWKLRSTWPASPGATSCTCVGGSPTALPPASRTTSSAQRG
ncbi:glycosyltransferase family 4 protein [Streptomyces sp. NPDC002533]